MRNKFDNQWLAQAWKIPPKAHPVAQSSVVLRSFFHGLLWSCVSSSWPQQKPWRIQQKMKETTGKLGGGKTENHATNLWIQIFSNEDLCLMIDSFNIQSHFWRTHVKLSFLVFLRQPHGYPENHVLPKQRLSPVRGCLGWQNLDLTTSSTSRLD